MSTTARPRAALRRAAVVLTAAIAPAVVLTGCSPGADDTPAPTERTEAVPESGSYVDGEYRARGWYGSLPSHQDVTLIIEDDIVTDVEITTPAEDDISLGYQERFAQALPEEIIGRPVDEIAIDRLAGASGCSEGFMNALAQIRESARADR